MEPNTEVSTAVVTHLVPPSEKKMNMVVPMNSPSMAIKSAR